MTKSHNTGFIRCDLISVVHVQVKEIFRLEKRFRFDAGTRWASKTGVGDKFFSFDAAVVASMREISASVHDSVTKWLSIANFIHTYLLNILLQNFCATS